MQVIKITAVEHEGNPDFFTAIVIQTSEGDIGALPWYKEPE
jgi:hypothetical protein